MSTPAARPEGGGGKEGGSYILGHEHMGIACQLVLSLDCARQIA